VTGEAPERDLDAHADRLKAIYEAGDSRREPVSRG
jgi:hypothetical protein